MPDLSHRCPLSVPPQIQRMQQMLAKMQEQLGKQQQQAQVNGKV